MRNDIEAAQEGLNKMKNIPESYEKATPEIVAILEEFKEIGISEEAKAVVDAAIEATTEVLAKKVTPQIRDLVETTAKKVKQGESLA